LVLREFAENDLNDLYELYRREDYRRYEGSPLSRKEVEDHLLWKIRDAGEQPRLRYYFAVTLPSSQMIGQVSARNHHPHISEWELGWGIHPDEWGKGYATEAARAMLDLVFNQQSGHRAVAFCHAGNAASARVMEKIGMQREGRTRETKQIQGVWYDELIYAILEKEYPGTLANAPGENR
jgi:RimJ/RimL family protein N-acetyltransferase